MAAPLAELLIVIGVDHEKAEKAVEAMSEKVKEEFKEMGKHVLEFLGVLGSMEAFASFFEGTIRSQVAIQRLSQEAHVGSEEISAMQIASERLGGSAEGVNGSLTALGEKLSVLGTKMRGAKMAGMALGMAMGYEGKQAEEMGVKIFKGKGPMEAMALLAEKMHGMDFFKAKKLGAMAGITDEATIRALVKTKEEYDELMEHAKRFAATQEETEASEKFEEAQKDVQAALHKVGMVIVEYILPVMQWMGDKLVLITEYAADHARVAQTVTWILVGLGAAFMLAAGNAAAGWAWMQMTGERGMLNTVLHWFTAGKAAEASGVEFEGAAAKSSTSWTGMAATGEASAAKSVASWSGVGVAADKTSMSYAEAATASEVSWTAQAAEAEEAELVGAAFYEVDAAAGSEVIAYNAAGEAASKSWLSQLGSAIKSGAKIVWGIAKVGAAWVKTGLKAMAAGIKMAAAWVVGLGPIAWVVAGIAAVIAILVALELKFHIFEAAWGWIKTAASDALNWIEGKLVAIGTLIKDYILAPFKAVSELLHGNFKGALNVGLDVVKDWGKVLGIGGNKDNAIAGMMPSYAGVGTLPERGPERRREAAEGFPVQKRGASGHAPVHAQVTVNTSAAPAPGQGGDSSKHIPTDQEFDAAMEAHHIMRMKAAAAHASSSIGAGAVVPPAMVNQSSSNQNSKSVDNHVTIGEINIHTQATDAKGIAGSVGTALEGTVNQSDGMAQ